MRKQVILLAAILVVAISAGCINQTQTTATEVNGLVIKNLAINPPADQIQLGETIEITADIENIGSATARNIVAELIRASWVTPDVVAQYPLGSIVVVNYGTFDEDGDGIPGTTLSPPDPRYDLPGQLKTIQFRLPAPYVPQGQKQSYDVEIRIRYDYETSAVAQINGYSNERYNSLYQMGKITPPATTEIPVQVSKNVPVTISLIGPDKFIAGPYLYDEYVYQLTFKNVGSNIPITIDPLTNRETDGLLLGTVWLQGPGVFFRDCLHITPELLYNNYMGISGLNNFFTNLQVDYSDRFSAWYQQMPWGDAWSVAGKIGNVFVGVQQTPTAPLINMPGYVLFPNALSWDAFGNLMDRIQLRRGESVTKSCTIGILNDPSKPGSWAMRPEDSMIFNAQLKYRYYIGQPITLTVSAPIIRSPPTY